MTIDDEATRRLDDLTFSRHAGIPSPRYGKIEVHDEKEKINREEMNKRFDI